MYDVDLGLLIVRVVVGVLMFALTIAELTLGRGVRLDRWRSNA